MAPNLDQNSAIPNEDSQDVQIDASNLFEPNRFPGYDRLEDQSRLTYGMRAGLYADAGSQLTGFLGQSYRLQEDDNPFPQGSGLNDQRSDFVGQLGAILAQDHAIDYRFQTDSENFSSQRHEVDFSTRHGRFDLGGQYLYALALSGLPEDDTRNQFKAGAGIYLDSQWRVRVGGTRDLGSEGGLREANLGLDFFGPCVSWNLTGKRDLTDQAAGESDTEVIFRIGLKNLGGFQETGYPLAAR
jgi:LPS-assembly protein